MSTYHAIVWLDRSEAHVIMFDREHVEAQKIKSRSQHKATGGHVGSHQGMHGRGDSASGHHSAQGGHASSDETFYHSVAEALKGVHEILVTGPAQAKDEFKAHCAHHDKDIDKAIIGVISSDHPSDGQLVAMAKQYFLKHDKMQGQA
jgi:stalled ribosome rescue protein Dom34